MDKAATTALAVSGVAAAGVGGYLLYRYLSGPPTIQGKPFSHWVSECGGLITDPTTAYRYSLRQDSSLGPLPCVEVINYMLYRLGYLPRSEARSAIFTIATEKAVMQFQQANNLPATGKVDPTTYAALVAAYDKKVSG
jgi:peptidoglycan hydrolase-like protein with peptidoglycan-binding domain